MKKVIIITYYWPPASGSGVQRFLKFSKYLRDFGWEPVILTVENGTHVAYDESLLNDIPKGVKVFKTKTFEPFGFYSMLANNKASKSKGSTGLQKDTFLQKLLIYIRANFFIPDARKGWYNFACKKAVEIIETEAIDAIITTGPPHSTHLIGCYLKDKIRLPWIADMRDPWTTVFYNEFFPRTKSTKKKDKNLEDLVLKSADLVTVVSKGMNDEFKDRANNICTIYNGFDEGDFKTKESSRSSKFTITYTGNFFQSQNIELLWKCIDDLTKEDAIFKENLSLNFVGNVDKQILDSLNRYNLSTFLEIEGFLPHDIAIDRMLSSSLLLLIIPNSERNNLIITGKIFEYLATSKPILSIGPNGNASDIISESGNNKMIDYNDYDEMKCQIISAYTHWKDNTVSVSANDRINKFSRKTLTGLLAEQLNSISD
jgi:glycosyltransferase involved in cell wall biosynthesis